MGIGAGDRGMVDFCKLTEQSNIELVVRKIVVVDICSFMRVLARSRYQNFEKRRTALDDESTESQPIERMSKELE